MKCISLFVFAIFGRVQAGFDAAQLNAKLVRDVSFAERAIDTQLRKDKAPGLVRQKEANLMKRIDHAAETVNHLWSKTQSLNKLESNHVSLLDGSSSIRAHVAREIDFIEHAVESQLKKDHAPAHLISEEQTLLGKASAIAHRSVELQTNLPSERAHKRKELSIVTIGTSLNSESRSASEALRTYAEDMATAVDNGKSEIKQIEHVHGQVMEALSEINATAGIQNKVNGLLGKVEHLEGKGLNLDKKVMLEAGQESANQSHKWHGLLRELNKGIQHVASEDQKGLDSIRNLEDKAKAALEKSGFNASTETKIEGLLKSVEKLAHNVVARDTHSVYATSMSHLHSVDQRDASGQVSLEALEAANSDLMIKNKALKTERAILLHEKELMEQNAALKAENNELNTENSQLQHELNVHT